MTPLSSNIKKGTEIVEGIYKKVDLFDVSEDNNTRWQYNTFFATVTIKCYSYFILPNSFVL